MSHTSITSCLTTTIDGEEERFQECFHGTLKRLNQQILLSYEETENEGRTQVKISEQSVFIHRQGHIKSKLRFLLGRRERADYSTPMGALDMEIHTHRMEQEQTPKGGLLRLDYTIYVFGKHTSDNVLTLKWNL